MKSVFITGGTRGIGFSIAEKMFGLNYRVIIGARNINSQDSQDLKNFECIEMDVSDRASVKRAILKAGDIDVFVANAGEFIPCSALQTTEAVWNKMIDVNLSSQFHCSSIVLPQMIDRGWGRFISVGSTASIKGFPGAGAYVAAKHGAAGWIKSLALELAKTGVTANMICPGYTDTDLLNKAIDILADQSDVSISDHKKHFQSQNPMNRFVKTDEVAALVSWLTEDASASINGQIIAVDGGASA